jgi:hypothetical protein
MKSLLARAAIADVVIGVVGFALAVTTSAPHGHDDPPIADAGWFIGFLSVPILVVLLLAIGIRAGMARNREGVAR